MPSNLPQQAKKAGILIPVSSALADAPISTDDMLRLILAAQNLIAQSAQPLTNTQLRATPVPVTGSFSVTGGLTDAELRATPVPMSLASTTISNFPASQAVTGPLTDSQLRATPVAVSGSLSVTGALTDAELRATPVPMTVTNFPASQAVTNVGTFAVQVTSAPTTTVTGTVTANAGSGTFAVSGPLTDAELRATPVPVSGTFFQATQPVSAVSLPLPSGAATAALQTQPGVDIGDVTVNNGSGAAAVNIQDGGNSITVDGTVAVSGSVAVTGPLTDSQLRASALPVSATQLPSALVGGRLDSNTGAWFGSTAPTVGQKTMANAIPVVIASDQTTLNVASAAASALFKGRASTFRTPGRAGTTGQKILSIHNATGSPVTVSVNKILVDIYSTVVKAITVPPPIIRVWKVTVLPTNGTSLTKNKIGGTSTSNASVTVLGDASADGTGSATALTATLPAGTFIDQVFASRYVTAAGYEPADTIEFEFENTVVLNALEGLVVFLDYTVATMNPTTDMWIASVEWSEM